MTTKNAFDIFTCNFRIVYKSLISVVIILFIFSSVCYAIYEKQIKGIAEEVKEVGMLGDTLEYVHAYLGADHQAADAIAVTLEEDYAEIADIFSTHVRSFTWAWISLFLAIVFFAFIFNNVMFCCADLTDKYMHSKMKYNLITSFVDNVKPSLLYALFNTLIFVPIEVAGVFFSAWLAIKLINSEILFSLPLAYLIIVSLYALILTFKAYWLPTVIHGKERVTVGLKKSFIKGAAKFPVHFGVFWIGIFLLTTISILLVIASFGTAMVFVVPSYPLFLIIEGFVMYYEDKKLPYYITDSQIKRSMETRY